MAFVCTKDICILSAFCFRRNFYRGEEIAFAYQLLNMSLRIKCIEIFFIFNLFKQYFNLESI